MLALPSLRLPTLLLPSELSPLLPAELVPAADQVWGVRLHTTVVEEVEVEELRMADAVEKAELGMGAVEAVDGN